MTQEYFEDTTEVVVLVLRDQAEDGTYYLIAKDRGNDFWEFVGGKMKKGEGLEQAVFRELEDEIQVDWGEGDVEIVKTGDPFESPQNQVYRLHPVLVEIDSETAWELGDEDLSKEHSRMEWIKLEELDDYNTFGEKQVLERLDIL